MSKQETRGNCVVIRFEKLQGGEMDEARVRCEEEILAVGNFTSWEMDAKAEESRAMQALSWKQCITLFYSFLASQVMADCRLC